MIAIQDFRLLTRICCYLALAGASPIVFADASPVAVEQQVTNAAYNHILTNIGVWSPDGQWIYYDVRSDVAGSVFDGRTIERVHVATGKVEVVYEARDGAFCGVVTASPVDSRVVFIHGPEKPTPDWSYAAFHRRGVVATPETEQPPLNLDARDLVAPFTPGALRGGSHVHVFSGDGAWVSFTYEDHVLATSANSRAQANQRNVGVAAPFGPVSAPRIHPRNHDGVAFSAIVTVTTDNPHPGSDEINRAYSDAWVGTNGYRRTDGTAQRKALAFLGDVVAEDGATVTELFIVDIPDDVQRAGAHPLEGTATTRPAPPAGVEQRRLTFTTDRAVPGVGGVRHWPRSAPDGSRIAFVMPDEKGVAQLWTISPHGGLAEQLTRNSFAVESAFSWRADGRAIACVAGGSVCQVDAATGETARLTPESTGADRPRPEACVYAPTGNRIAYVRTVESTAGGHNQVFIVGDE